jgi:2-haloacid dehalogenase
MGMDRCDVRLLIFDVFGTLVDWRTSIARTLQSTLGAVLGGASSGAVGGALGGASERASEGTSGGAQRGAVTAQSLADAWRAAYQPSMQRIRSGERGYVPLDVLHRENLDTVLAAHGLSHVDDATRVALTLAWHRLDAWPDVGAGLKALREQVMLAPCSNGNVALMADLARHNGWHWDAIVGADMARDYKPAAIVYRRAVEVFGCRPEHVMMVAAHSSDLEAAAREGLRTAFVARPDEHGPGLGEAQASVPVDVSVNDLAQLAVALRG